MPEAIIQAMNKKDLAKVTERVASNPALVNTRAAGFDLTPFQHACAFARRDFALLFLAHGAEVKQAFEAPQHGGFAGLPLHLAIAGDLNATQQVVDDRTDLAAAILEAGSPVDAQALKLACCLGAGKAKRLAQLLLGRLPAGAIAQGGGELLRAAVEYDHPEVLDAALAAGLPVDDVSTTFPKGTTALHLAVKKRSAGFVAKLVAAGARSDLKDQKGDTARSLAPKALLAILEGKAAPKPKEPAPVPPAADQAERSEWREQLWKTPTDRQALSVFADWLLEHGETTRGEFIQLSLLPRPTEAQRKRAAQLRAKNRGAWLGAARPAVLSWDDSDESPGFVARATVAPEKLLASFEPIRALGPRLVVTLTRVKTRRLTGQLAGLPLGTLYGLDLRNPTASHANTDWLDDTATALLAPALPGLRSLTVAPENQQQHGGFTAKSFEALAEAVGPSLEALTLELSPHWAAPALVASLRPTAFPRLAALRVSGASPATRAALTAQWKGRLKPAFSD